MVIYVNIYFLIIFILISIIAYLLQKIEKQKIKIIYLSRQNFCLTQNNHSKNLNKKFFENISNIEIEFIKINSHKAFLKNTSYIKIAPFDFAPKIINIHKNTEIKILSKILISKEYWYEIIVNDNSSSYNLKGWIKDHGIEFIYPKHQNLTKSINNKYIF